MNSILKVAVLFLIAMSFISCSSKESAKRESKIKKKEEVEDFGDSQCVINDEFDPGETGLFESRAVIQIVSFEDTTYSEQPCELVEGKFKTINQIEAITLNDFQKKGLEKILFKTKSKRTGNVSTASACYVPRHAIVFSGSQEVVAFTEICFECNGQRANGKINTYIDFCDGKWGELKLFLNL